MSEKKIRGKVIQREYAKSSKSQHQAVMLDTGKKEYKLRRLGGSPFKDEELLAMVGLDVEIQCIAKGKLLIIKEWKEISEKSKKKTGKKKTVRAKKSKAKKSTVVSKKKSKNVTAKSNKSNKSSKSTKASPKKKGSTSLKKKKTAKKKHTKRSG